MRGKNRDKLLSLSFIWIANSDHLGFGTLPIMAKGLWKDHNSKNKIDRCMKLQGGKKRIVFDNLKQLIRQQGKGSGWGWEVDVIVMLKLVEEMDHRFYYRMEIAYALSF